MNDIIYAGRHQQTPSTPLHQHEHWELLYCTSGTGAFLFDEAVQAYHAGDVVIIPPDTPHVHTAEQGASCIYLYMADAALAFRQPMTLQDDAHQGLLHLFDDADAYSRSDLSYRAALLPAYGQLIVQHISARRTSSAGNRLVEEIAQSIVQNYANPNYELDELLHSAPYCYDYLCRLFRQELHTTPHKYLASLRLQAAADILRTGTSRSVTEISRMCGYHDPLYFSRMFKKRYGVSPREYARQPKDDAGNA